MRRYAEDVGTAAGFAALGVVLLLVLPEAGLRQGPGTPPVGVSLAMIGIAAAGQVLRRRRPLVALAVAAAVVLTGVLGLPGVLGLTGVPGAGGVPLGVVLIFGETLYCAVLYTSRRVGIGVAVATAAVAAGFALVAFAQGGGRAGVLMLLNLALLLAVPVAWASEVRAHRERADAERDRAEQERRVGELDRAAAVTAERNRMARDLHDVVAGQLSAIAIQSEAALSVPDAAPEVLRRVLGEVRRGSVASLAEMRTMIGLLRADGADEPRTAPAGLDRLDSLLATARAGGLRVELDDRRPAGAVAAAAVDLVAYRVVQESLANAAKHAPGSRVRCALHVDGARLRIEVVNDLVPGAPAGDGTRTGLLGLTERAGAVGGRVDAGPDADTWAVRAELPVTA